MTPRESNVLLNGTLVRSLNDKAHHLVNVGYVGTIIDYLPSLSMYKILYNVTTNKVVKADMYREEFEVVDSET